MRPYKPIFHYCVMTENRGDQAIRIAIERAIHKYIPEIPIAYFNCKGETLSEKRVKQFNNDASALIIGGSGLYSNYPYDTGWYFPSTNEAIRQLNLSIALIGIGCNQNLKNDIFKGELSDKAKESIKLINDKAVISTVRDGRTYNILSGITGNHRHELVLDPANFLYLEGHYIFREKRVAINIAQHAPILGRFDGDEAGKRMREKNLNYFANISTYLIKQGYSVVFIAHDALEQSLIIDIKKRESRIEYLNTNNIDEILEEYERCRFSIGMKMHSNILSFAMGTPFISVYYDQKSIEYMKLLNWNYSVNVFDDYYSRLEFMVKEMMNNHLKYIIRCIDLKEQEEKKFLTGIKNLCSIIKITH